MHRFSGICVWRVVKIHKKAFLAYLQSNSMKKKADECIKAHGKQKYIICWHAIGRFRCLNSTRNTCKTFTVSRAQANYWKKKAENPSFHSLSRGEYK